jgi:xylan 1,4-beta-xylosidase
VWKEDDWLYLAQGGIEPAITIEAENHVGQPWEPENSRNDFDDSVLSPMYQMLRCKLDERFCNLTEREGYLRLRGKETVTSWFEQTLVVRRQTSFYNQMEGLIAFYDHRQFFYIAVTYQDGPVIKLYCCKQSVWIESIKAVPLGNSERVYIRMNTHYDHLQCSYSMYETVWNTLGPWFDSSILSDEYLQPMHIFRSVCGSVCSALDGSDFVADFDYFTYEELDDAF